MLGPLEEAGALMGERSEVREADRYANLAVGYLLQRFGDKAVTRSRRRICCPRVRARAASPFRCRPLSRSRHADGSGAFGPRISMSPRPWWSTYSSATAEETSRSPVAKKLTIARVAASESVIRRDLTSTLFWPHWSVLRRRQEVCGSHSCASRAPVTHALSGHLWTLMDLHGLGAAVRKPGAHRTGSGLPGGNPLH